jgi:hypothetical protein
MSRIFHVVLMGLALSAAGFGQQLTGGEMNSMRVSVSAYTDGRADQTAGQVGMEWMQAVSNRGILRGSLSLVQGGNGDGGSVRAGRSFLEWNALGSGKKGFTATAGTFLLNPSRFENQNSTIYLPSVLTQGVRTEVTRGATTFGSFAGAFVIEEGGRLLSTHATNDKIAGVYLTRALTRSLSVGIEADRLGGSTHLRQSVNWTLKKKTVMNGEYDISSTGKPSMHASLEHSGSRLSWSAAYVKRGTDYMPYGVLAYSADREGPSAEATFQATQWLTFSGGLTRLRTNVARDASETTARSRQYNVNTSVRLPANLQLVLAHNVSAISRDNSAIVPRQSLTIDSASILHSHGMWITRVGVDQLQLNAGDRTLTRGFNIDETRIFRNGLSLSGTVRYQSTREAARHTGRLSTAIRGSYEIGNRISLSLQTEFGRDIRNETLFATSNLRTNSASVGIKLPRNSELRFEYYGTQSNYLLNTDSAMASALLGSLVTPVLSESSRSTFYVRYQKTLRWRKDPLTAGASSAINVTLAQATGSVAGRICVDENENKRCDAGEPGVSNTRVSIGERQSAVTNADGLYVVSNVGVGPRTVELSIETLDAAFTPAANQHNVTVVLHATAAADFTVVAASTVSGMVAQKKGDDIVPLADAAVQLEPGGRYAYTDSTGRFVISNVPRGEFHLTLVKETIPENARVLETPADGGIARPGETVRDANFLVQIVETQPQIERLPAERVRVSVTN